MARPDDQQTRKRPEKRNEAQANSSLDFIQTIELVAALSATVLAALATAAGRALFSRSSDIDGKGAPVNGFASHGLDGFLRLFGRAHGDETEPARTAGGPVHYQVGFNDGAVGCERILQIVFGGVEGKISDKQFIVHVMFYLLS
jgi:hypothetical protein